MEAVLRLRNKAIEELCLINPGQESLGTIGNLQGIADATQQVLNQDIFENLDQRGEDESEE